MNALEQLVDDALEIAAASADDLEEIDEPTTHDYIPYRLLDANRGAPCANGVCGASRANPVHLVRP